MFRLFSLAILALALAPSAAFAWKWSGDISAEYRGFLQVPADPRQGGNDFSLSFSPELYQEWDKGHQSFTFAPYFRHDFNDSERTHADIRELTWLKAGASSEWRVGIRKVFWGVTESVHLVDIINQTDLVENPDGEQKLGQPMINFALIQDWGTLDLFVLPGFRERTFPGVEGRLRTSLVVDADHPVYESGSEDDHVDYALRWSNSIGDWDIGLSHFYGTSRDPRFLPGLKDGEPVLFPVYDLINQTGVDVQATLDNWLLKLEAIRRTGQGEGYYAAASGFEYTFYGVFDTQKDVGLIAEYLWDERQERALTPFQNDVFLGTRLAFNDEASSEVLFGFIRDLDHDSTFANLEASRRIGSSWKLILESRLFSVKDAADPLTGLRNDDYVGVELKRYF